MAFESLKAEIALLFEQMAEQPHDRRELYLQLKEKLNQYRAFGTDVPQDFVELEEALDREFIAMRQHPVPKG